MPPFPKTVLQQVEWKLQDALDATEKMLAASDFGAEDAKLVRLNGRIEGLTEAVKAVAIAIDGLEVEQTARDQNDESTV